METMESGLGQCRMGLWRYGWASVAMCGIVAAWVAVRRIVAARVAARGQAAARVAARCGCSAVHVDSSTLY
jgi:hypothetical protein